MGRFNVTKDPADKFNFKVPSLRNVAVTAPYFHDGSAKTLEEAVDVMFRFQLGRSAPKDNKDAIVAFLRTLTGEYMGKSLDQP
jgi:cytochrome c peroxidase